MPSIAVSPILGSLGVVATTRGDRKSPLVRCAPPLDLLPTLMHPARAANTTSMPNIWCAGLTGRASADPESRVLNHGSWCILAHWAALVKAKSDIVSLGPTSSTQRLDSNGNHPQPPTTSSGTGDLDMEQALPFCCSRVGSSSSEGGHPGPMVASSCRVRGGSPRHSSRGLRWADTVSRGHRAAEAAAGHSPR